MNPYLLLAFSIVAEVMGTTALRLSEGFSKPVPAVLVAVCYGATFFLMSQTLKSIPIGTTYAIWSGVGTALTALVGWFYFRDAFHWGAVAGIALIIAGVVVLQLSGAGKH